MCFRPPQNCGKWKATWIGGWTRLEVLFLVLCLLLAIVIVVLVVIIVAMGGLQREYAPQGAEKVSECTTNR